MAEGLRGYLHSIESLGALDGPGLRTVVFLYGCPFRCVYCHNPDTWTVPTSAKPYTVQEVVDKVLRYRNYFGKAGGVTLSGGEPLSQTEFCIVLLRAFKELGIHTALDTAGAIFCEEALSLADLTILDIKHTNDAKFKEITANDSHNTYKTLKFLIDNNKHYWLRQVIVPGLSDGEDNIIKLRELGGRCDKIELLPYHTLGRHKWEKLGLEYSLCDIVPPSIDTMNRLNKIVQTK